MTRAATAWVLMTAMPPTKGHLHLIQFASELARRVTVLVCTQPGEPYVLERPAALRAATAPLGNVSIEHFHRTMPQEPEDAADFWPQWMQVMHDHGLPHGAAHDHLVVASEPYGQVIADRSGTTFVPYDLGRDIYPVRAAQVRADPLSEFRHILPEFQPHLRRTVSVIGAESTGKTTLSRALAATIDGVWLPEWARPYLELAPTQTLDVAAMTTIWHAQRAMHRQVERMHDRPFIVRDTDLVSTLGFWRYWSPETVPEQLEHDACASAADLTVITRSNIPFEADPLRYGGDRRETPDQYWIDLADELGLASVVLDAADAKERVDAAADASRGSFAAHSQLAYVRAGRH